MTRTIRYFAFVSGIVAMALTVACSSSASIDGEIATNPEPTATSTAVAESTPGPTTQSPSSTSIQPLQVTRVQHNDTEFEVAFTAKESAPILDYLWYHGSLGNVDTAEILEAAETVDFESSMLVATTVEGCVLDEIWLEPVANALVRYDVFNENVDCAESVPFTAVFAVSLTGPGSDGNPYTYSADAVPEVVPSSADLSQFSLTAKPYGATDLYTLPQGAIQAEAVVGLRSIELADEDTTRFVLDEQDLDSLLDDFIESGWIAGQRQLADFDLDNSYAAFVTVHACSPQEVWANHSDGELVFSFGEGLVLCEVAVPYGALFALPRAWLADAGEPTFAVQTLYPN